jgi:predicted metal-binding protein
MLKDFEGQIIVDTRIAFGGVAGCGSFGRPADAWKHIMLAEFNLVTIFRWVDDNLFVQELSSTVEMEEIVARSDKLGVKTNPTKISPFKSEQKYIGFIWNAAEKTVRLPEEKTQARIRQILDILEHREEFTYKQIEIMTGRLNHVSYMLPQLRCYLCSMYRMMNNWFHRKIPRPLPLDARQDMLYWLKTL